MSSSRIAIAHEWVDSRAGSEKTFEALAQAFPSADLFSLSVAPGVVLDTGGRPIHTSFLDSPTLRDRRHLTLPLMPSAWKRITTNTYDLVITSSHAFARWFGPAREAKHVSFTHAPMRYVWSPELDTRTHRLSPLIQAAAVPLKRMDLASLRWTDRLLANSNEIKNRIARYYGVDADVVHPPVDVGFFAALPVVPMSERGDYLLAFSRFIPYKRLDLAIRAAAANGMPLIVAGHGPEEQALRNLAQEHDVRVEFRVRPSDEDLRELARRARGLIFGALEDFGLVPVEAQAAGTPVVALGAGGALDTVVNGKTGVLAPAQSVDAFTTAVRSLLETQFDASTVRAHALQFSVETFQSRIKRIVREIGFDLA